MPVLWRQLLCANLDMDAKSFSSNFLIGTMIIEIGNYSNAFFRYYMLLPHKTRPKSNFESCCISILQATLANGEKMWSKGKTKIFLKDGIENVLELKRTETLKKSIATLERWIFAWAERRRYLKTFIYIKRIQKSMRILNGKVP